MTFTDEEKEKIIIEMIRSYKNTSLSDDDIKSKYSTAIIYMDQNFDNMCNESVNSNVSSMTQGSRSVTYKASMTIANNPILVALLGKPCVRVW